MKCTCGCRYCCKDTKPASERQFVDSKQLVEALTAVSDTEAEADGEDEDEAEVETKAETEVEVEIDVGTINIDFKHEFFGLDPRAFRLPRPDQLALPAGQAVGLVKTTAAIIRSGLSVAKATEYKLTTNDTTYVKQAALAKLSPEQLEMYRAWVREAYILPDIDWKKDKLPCSQSTKMKSRAKAMAKLYAVPVATVAPENYQWLAQTNKEIANMVVAIDAFSTAKRQLQGGQSKLSANEFAEYQTLKSICKAYNKSFDCVPRREAYHERTKHDREVIDNRRDRLKAKLVR